MLLPRLRAALAALAICLVVGDVAPIDAQKVHVKGYTKKDGTYVPPHDRKAPSKKAETEKPVPPPAPIYASAPARDEHGRFVRSEAARRAFMRETGYPTGRPGYVIDHIRPLACGGADAPANMQWQTLEDAKAKDGWERKGC